MPTILKAWGVLSSTPLDLSNGLKRLRINHSIIGKSSSQKVSQHRVVKGLAKEQPAWPVIMHSVKEISRLNLVQDYQRLILFVFDSRAAIMCTNLSPLVPSEDNLQETIKYSLTNLDPAPFKFQQYAPTLSDFVNIASKPSVLNELQTTYYKINPYSQRKVVQKAIIHYLAGSLRLKNLKSILRATLRGEEILTMLQTSECQNLMAAIKEVRDGLSLDAASAKFNIDSFDISYVLTSEKKFED